MPRSWFLSTCGLLTHKLMSIFQAQTVLSHELFLQVFNETITLFYLTEWLKDGSEGWLMWSLACFLALFPGFRICVEKSEYKALKLPNCPPPTCLWGPQALQCSRRALCTAFQELNGQVHDSGQRQWWVHWGLLTPSFLWKDASTRQLPTWESHFETDRRELIL